MNLISKYLAIGLLSAASVVGLAACGGDNGSGGGTAPSAMSNADLLKAAVSNMKAAKSYTLDVTGVAAGTPITMSGPIDVVNKNSSISLQSGGQSIVMTTILSDTFTSIDGGKTFTKSPATAGGFDSFTAMWTKTKPDDVDKSKDALKDGTPATETIDGAATKHMTADAAALTALNPNSSSAPTAGASSSSGATPTVEGVTGTYDIWVSTDANPTVRQMRLVGKSGGQDSSFTIKWSKINEAVDIKAPPTTP
ncbi:MAG: hypothetical protein M3014_03870 [Chloroflexota bacterium]|nr:hypothetical protein [Chloroflexota bacterium]